MESADYASLRLDYVHPDAAEAADSLLIFIDSAIYSGQDGHMEESTAVGDSDNVDLLDESASPSSTQTIDPSQIQSDAATAAPSSTQTASDTFDASADPSLDDNSSALSSPTPNNLSTTLAPTLILEESDVFLEEESDSSLPIDTINPTTEEDTEQVTL